MDYLYFTAFIFLSSYQGIFATSVSEVDNVIQLDMEENSAAYIFSQSNQSDNIAIENLKHDRQNKTFNSTWHNAEQNMECGIPTGLRKEHMLAIYAYTADFPENNPFYRIFNEEVRLYGATDEIYAKRFQFKSFHYLLTVALEKLKNGSKGSAEMTYRGIRKLAEGMEGSAMRFGSFASSSLDKDAALYFIDIATKSNTLFEISTLYGTSIGNYSCFPEEDEILIPPYEVFRVGQTSPRKYGRSISLMGQRRQGVQVKLETDKHGVLVVVRSKALQIYTWGGLWILAALVFIVI